MPDLKHGKYITSGSIKSMTTQTKDICTIEKDGYIWATVGAQAGLGYIYINGTVLLCAQETNDFHDYDSSLFPVKKGDKIKVSGKLYSPIAGSREVFYYLIYYPLIR